MINVTDSIVFQCFGVFFTAWALGHGLRAVLMLLSGVAGHLDGGGGD